MRKQKGILAIFEDPDSLKDAASKVHRMQIKKFDAYTPFAIHGLEKAMGLKRSWIPWATLFLGLVGWCLGFYFQVWTMAIDWPVNVGGKPYIAWPAYIPITFESMVLIGGVSTVLILFAVCKLPNWFRPVLDKQLTNDRFGLFISEDDPNFSVTVLNRILKESGAEEIKEI